MEYLLVASSQRNGLEQGLPLKRYNVMCDIISSQLIQSVLLVLCLLWQCVCVCVCVRACVRACVGAFDHSKVLLHDIHARFMSAD